MDVGTLLRGLGLGQYEQAFRDNDVDARVLPGLTADDLKEIGVASVGHRRLILQAIAKLSASPAPVVPTGATTEIASPDARTARLQAERRQLTIMFADLVGSVELSRRFDPEQMREVLHGFQGAVAGGVARFDGHIANFLGDGVLCYFGWPRAQEDAAERAVRAGLAITAAVAALRAPDGKPLACRIGIATGRVVVGELIGKGFAAVEAVVGETPNLAARLQRLAEPGAVVVAEDTHRLLGSMFTYCDLGAVPLKGFAGPVRAWCVVGEGGAEDRFAALHAAGLTPLVGREHELALLLDRWERAREGEGQVVLLSGEPGIGKSRLVRGLREQLANEPHIALSHFCSPYHANTALHPVIDLLERAAGLRREEPPERQLEKVGALLEVATDDVAQVVSLLADLLGIETTGRYPALDLSPQQKKERTLRALLDQLTGLAARRPVLALYEDVHWADPTTLELLGSVVARVQRVPVLVLVSFRPEFASPWTGYGHVTALSLSRLGRRQGAAVIDWVAEGKTLPAEVLEGILVRTDGVPLFVEELTKAVLESGLLRDEGDRYTLDGSLPPLAIPLTLQDSLMARLDRLGAVKEVAQVAAVIGREFSRELLAAIVPLDGEELDRALARLVAAELVSHRRDASGVGYAFKHALVHDAAYESLLKSRRQELHGRIAALLETHFPEAATTEPELLARHYARAGFAEQAVGYWQRAAERAIGRSANLEAIAHCESAETQLGTMPPSDGRARAELEIQLAKGIALRAGKGYSAPQAERVFLRACELCEELGDRQRLAYALRGLWAFYIVSARWRDAARIAERFGSAAAGLNNRLVLSLRYYVEGTTQLFCGEPAEAASRLREGLLNYDEGDRDTDIRLSGLHTGITIRANLSIAEWVIGLPEQAALTNAEALEWGRRLAHPFSVAHTLHQGALLRMLWRDWDAAEVLAAELRETADRYGIAQYLAFGGLLEGIAIAARREVAIGANLIREGIETLRRIGWAYIVPLALVNLASALGRAGDGDAALAAARGALQIVRTNGELIWEAEALRVLGDVKRSLGLGEADADLQAALEVARRQGAKSFELRAAVSLVHLWAERGERRKAHELLASVYGLFSEGFDTPDLRDARALLDELALAPTTRGRSRGGDPLLR